MKKKKNRPIVHNINKAKNNNGIMAGTVTTSHENATVERKKRPIRKLLFGGLVMLSIIAALIVDVSEITKILK